MGDVDNVYSEKSSTLIFELMLETVLISIV